MCSANSGGDGREEMFRERAGAPAEHHSVSEPTGTSPDQTVEQGRLRRATQGVLPVQFDALPPELHAAAALRFVLWRYALGPRGELKKPPLCARTGRRASHSDPTSWASLSVVRAAYEAGGYAGIGLVLTGGLVALDLDECVVSAKDGSRVAPWAQTIIEQLHTYWEYSPSGTGVRGLLFGAPPGALTRRGHIEVYEKQRYVTLTGAHLPGTSEHIARDDGALAAVYARIFAPPMKREHSVAAADRAHDRGQRPASGELDAVIAKARAAKNGATFERYMVGDTSLWSGKAARHASKSEADFTFCLLLSYWTHEDGRAMDAIFRRSGLYDAKWDRATSGKRTYGELTIERAIQLSRNR